MPGAVPRLRGLYGCDLQDYEVAVGETSWGNGQAASVRIANGSLAPVQFAIRRSSWGLTVEDPSGKQATHLNGMPLNGRTPFREGDILQAGTVAFELVSARWAGLPVVHRGRRCRAVPIGRDPLDFGRDPSSQVLLPDASIAGRHVRVSVEKGEPRIRILCDSGDVLLNGRAFEHHELVAGDLLRLGAYRFVFDGRRLVPCAPRAGFWIRAENLGASYGKHRVFEGLDLVIGSGEFVGVIGPTGAGKSTLLAILAGLQRASSGTVKADGVIMTPRLARSLRQFGWVPQDNAVTPELPAGRAFWEAARLRLPAGTPHQQVSRLVERTLSRMGVLACQKMRVGSLSGGERRKVQVGVELIGRPSVLFLDEPCAGLDPLAEAELMGHLRNLADSGPTIVCSTHHMASTHLLDRLVILAPGRVVYSGPPAGASAALGARDLREAFANLTDRAPAAANTRLPRNLPVRIPTPAPRAGGQLGMLHARFWAVLFSDWRNGLILLGQPALIGVLIGWAVSGTADDTALKLFFAGVATLWFGCSNGAQSVVAERPVYRRERMADLRPSSYLLAKMVHLTLLAMMQAAVLFAILKSLPGGLVGEGIWQAAGLGFLATFGASLGLAISAGSRSALQAAFWVPLLMIPQIVLSGYTVPASRMVPPVREVARFTPLYQSQSIMDTSLLWNRPVNAQTIQSHLGAMENLRGVSNLETGREFADPRPASSGLLGLLAWTAVCLGFARVFLRLREAK